MKHHPRPTAAERRELRRQRVRDEATSFLDFVECTPEEIEATQQPETAATLAADMKADEAERLQP